MEFEKFTGYHRSGKKPAPANMKVGQVIERVMHCGTKRRVCRQMREAMSLGMEVSIAE